MGDPGKYRYCAIALRETAGTNGTRHRGDANLGGNAAAQLGRRQAFQLADVGVCKIEVVCFRRLGSGFLRGLSGVLFSVLGHG